MPQIYKVTARGVNGSEFVYEVTGPKGATDAEVAMVAYGKHGDSLKSGWITEPLTPFYTVE